MKIRSLVFSKANYDCQKNSQQKYSKKNRETNISHYSSL